MKNSVHVPAIRSSDRRRLRITRSVTRGSKKPFFFLCFQLGHYSSMPALEVFCELNHASPALKTDRRSFKKSSQPLEADQRAANIYGDHMTK